MRKKTERERYIHTHRHTHNPSSVSCMATHKIVMMLCLGARSRYNLVVDKDIKKPNKQTNIHTNVNNPFVSFPHSDTSGGDTELSRQFVCSVVACFFLCIFPERARDGKSRLNGINFTTFFKHLPL